MIALSIRQPWAHAIVHLGKRIENRSWSTAFRGTFAIHASASTGSLGDFTVDCVAMGDILHCDTRWTDFRDAHLDIVHHRGYDYFAPRASLQRGGIVGIATLVDVIRPTGLAPDGVDTRWHAPDQCGFVLANVRATPFVPCKGTLGFWAMPRDVEEALR